MAKFRILHVNTMDQNGGAAQLASNLLEGTLAAGHHAEMAVRTKRTSSHHVFVIANDASRNPWARLWSRINNSVGGSSRWAKVIGRPLNSMRVWCGHEDFDFPGTWKILNDCPGKPDILHLHNLHGHYFDLRALPWLSRQVPTVVTLHDAWLMSGHCAHGFECSRWQTGCGHCPDLNIAPAIRHDATAYNWRRKTRIFSQSRLHVVSPSQDLMRKARESMLAPAIVSSRVISHGVDLSIFKPGNRLQARADLNLPHDEIILLFAAAGIRNNIWKDYATMRQAFEILARRHGTRNLLFLALGENAPSERIAESELRFIPHSSDRMTLAKYYQAADIYVHGARAEAWGLTITEAMACSLPVVASAVGGIPDQISESQNGFLVPVGDPALMADKILRLIEDSEARETMAHAACSRAHAEFGISHMTHNYLDYYTSILANNPSTYK